MVHRDLKPANILLADRNAPDSVRISDLGFAKQVRLSMKLGRLGLLLKPQFSAAESREWLADDALLHQVVCGARSVKAPR